MKTLFAAVALALAMCTANADVASTYLLDAPDRIEWQSGGLYDGRFEDGTRFQIELEYEHPASLPAKWTSEFYQSYWYPSHFNGDVINLVTYLRTPTQIELNSMRTFGAKPQEQFFIALSADRLNGQGTWTSAQLHKTMSFTIQRVILYKSVFVTRPSPETTTDSEKRPFVFSSVYPQLDDQVADAWVREQAGKCEGDLECGTALKVSWRSKSLVTIIAKNWSYNFGAAHGNFYWLTHHYSPQLGMWKALSFARFIDQSPACRSKVSTLLVKKLRAKGLSRAENGELNDRYDPQFRPTPTGIYFDFNLYDVGTYAEGAQSAFLTRAELGNCAKNLPRYD